MNQFVRYAVYYAPPAGPLKTFADAWLGWESTTGTPQAHLDLPGLPRPIETLTETPRKYGFHGTLKPPFRLSSGSSFSLLDRDLTALTQRLAPVYLDGLALTRLGGFLALVPIGNAYLLSRLAAEVVAGLDRHRAPALQGEIDRRRAAGLTRRQEAHLIHWGYPYVMDEFRFHLTLTGRLSTPEIEQVKARLADLMPPILPRPFPIEELTLFGEDEDGRFHEIDRYPLLGS